jgi:signal transduction histidine kinase
VTTKLVARVFSKNRLPQAPPREGRNYDLPAILEAIQLISARPAGVETLAGAAERAAHLIGVERCLILRWDREAGSLISLADYVSPAAGLSPATTQPEELFCDLSGYPAAARVLRKNSPVLVRAAEWPGQGGGLQNPSWAGVWLIPLSDQNRVVGLLGLYMKEQARRLAADELTLCRILAAQVAVALNQAQLLADLKRKKEEVRRISRQLVSAQEAERRRIARELHDEMGQALTAMKINLDIAGRALSAEEAASPQVAKLRHNLKEARSLAAQTLERARNLSLDLRPPMLDDLGLAAALRWTVDRYEGRTGQKLHFKVDLAGRSLPPELEITLYRLINEALTNAARHAQAGQVWVYLGLEKDRLLARVQDNGQGFDAAAWLQDPAASASLGLISMRERTELLGGEFTVISKPGQGTRVEARFSLPGS